MNDHQRKIALEQYVALVDSLELIMFGNFEGRPRDQLEAQAVALRKRADRLAGMEEDWKRYISRP